MKIVLIGPGDIDYHFTELLEIPKDKLTKQVLNITKVLVDSESEIVLMPDKGIAFEIALKYKEMRGKKIIATVPKEDKDFGINHLQPYLDSGIFNEVIDTNNWFKQDATIGLYGNVILLLGKTLGTIKELTSAFYLYKLFKGYKPEVSVVKEKLNSSAVAGNEIPFTVLVYMPFCKGKLSFEIESYIKKAQGQVVYIKNPKELKEKLNELNM